MIITKNHSLEQILRFNFSETAVFGHYNYFMTVVKIEQFYLFI